MKKRPAFPRFRGADAKSTTMTFLKLGCFQWDFLSIIPVSGRITPIDKPLEKPFRRGPTYNWDDPPSTPPKFNTSPLKAMVVERLLSFWGFGDFSGANC